MELTVLNKTQLGVIGHIEHEFEQDNKGTTILLKEYVEIIFNNKIQNRLSYFDQILHLN